MNNQYLLNLIGISKSFPGVKALNNVDFMCNKGEIVSIVGQNGAGKSTLANIIAGIHVPDSGDIFIEGKKVRISNPAVAKELGISMVHQEPTLVSVLTVSANLYLNREYLKNGFILDFKKMKQESNKILDTLGFKIDPERLVEDLTLVEREVIEIAKAMLIDPRILILDEVTSPLDTDGVNSLFALMKELKSKGMSIIFISHRLNEIIQISDRIVVFRDGEKVGDLDSKGKFSIKEIIDLMLGEKTIERSEKTEEIYIQGKQLLKVEHLSKENYFKDINFNLHNSEILGFAGLKGSGITELFKTIYGILIKDSGEIFIKDKRVITQSPKDSIRNGIGMITNERQKEGLALIRSVEENITISSLDFLANRFSFFRPGILRKNAEKYISILNIITPSLKQEVLYLSGGNQQKVLIAKLLLKGFDVIIIDEPTRGVDVKTKSEIYKILKELKTSGKGIIITSPEIPELLGICDRILIVTSGSIVGEVKRLTDKFNETNILGTMHIDVQKFISASH